MPLSFVLPAFTSVTRLNHSRRWTRFNWPRHHGCRPDSNPGVTGDRRCARLHVFAKGNWGTARSYRDASVWVWGWIGFDMAYFVAIECTMLSCMSPSSTHSFLGLLLSTHCIVIGHPFFHIPPALLYYSSPLEEQSPLTQSRIVSSSPPLIPNYRPGGTYTNALGGARTSWMGRWFVHSPALLCMGDLVSGRRKLVCNNQWKRSPQFH